MQANSVYNDADQAGRGFDGGEPTIDVYPSRIMEDRSAGNTGQADSADESDSDESAQVLGTVTIPSSELAKNESSRYLGYLTVNGTPMSTEYLCKDRVSTLGTPSVGGLAFSVRFTWYRYAYCSVVIHVIAPGTDLENRRVATMTIKGPSINKIERYRCNGRKEVVEQLQHFCKDIGEVESLPRRLLRLTIEANAIRVEVNDDAATALEAYCPEASKSLSTLCNTLAEATDNTKLDVVFNATRRIGITYLEGVSNIVITRAASDKDRSSQLYPFKEFFKKSPRALQLHYGNCPVPGTPDHPDIDVSMPAVNTYDTPEEQLVAQIMGGLNDFAKENDNAYNLHYEQFNGRALQLNHVKDGKRFLLMVENTVNDLYLPREGEQCFIKLIDVKRHQIPGNAQIDSLIDILTTNFAETVNNAVSSPDVQQHLTEHLQQYFKESLTLEHLETVMKSKGESIPAHKARIKAWVRDLFEGGELADTAFATGHDYREDGEGADDRTWWRAERISTPIAGAYEGSHIYVVTLPLVPQNEADEEGNRPVIDVTFPILKWDQTSGTDTESLERQVSAHFNDTRMVLKVQFKAIVSNKSLKAQVNAINDLHTPWSADRDSYPSGWSQATYRWLLDFAGDAKHYNVFLKYPHMKYIIEDQSKVHPHLVKLWNLLDENKQDAYRKLDNVKQNLNWILGVAGSGKTSLLIFIIMMGMYGELGTTYPLKTLHIVNHNQAVSDFAEEMNKAFEEFGVKNKVLRLYNMETEIDDWSREHIRGRGADPFDHEDAQRALLSLADHALIEQELARLSLDVHHARRVARNPKLVTMSLHTAAYRWYKDREASYPEILSLFSTRAANGKLEDSELKELEKHVEKLYSDFLEEWDGVICATPYFACSFKFRKVYKPDIINVDEATRISELDLLMVIARFTPTIFNISGDTYQLPPFVRGTHKGEALNPWENQLRTPTMLRAVNVGGIIKSRLILNHRQKGGLSRLPSKLIYNDAMEPAVQGAENFPASIHRWNDFLRSIFSQMPNNQQRLLIEISNSKVAKIGSSTYNIAHVKFLSEIVLRAIKDDSLTNLKGGPSTIALLAHYKAQVHKYQMVFDNFRRYGKITKEQLSRIQIRSLDSSQGHSADFVVSDFVQTSCPGFTSNRKRNCVGLTRSKQAEIIVLNRGTFVDWRIPEEEQLPDHDIRLLKRIYEELQLENCVLSLQCCPTCFGVDHNESECPVADTTWTSEGDVVPAADITPISHSSTTCSNCEEPGHSAKECPKPLVCWNYHELGHLEKRCTKPTKCFNCGSTEHTSQRCDACRHYKKHGHTKKDYPKLGRTCDIECYNCGKKGHKASECINPKPARDLTNMRYKECGEFGHLRKDCNFCIKCKEEGHVAKRCPTRVICRNKNCGERGHKAIDCPKQQCAMCLQYGHHEQACPTRYIDDDHEITRVPRELIIPPRRKNRDKIPARLDTNDDFAKLVEEVNRIIPEDMRPKLPTSMTN